MDTFDSYAVLSNPKRVTIDPDTRYDCYNRYKMTQLLIEYINGRTNLVNLDTVANDIKVTPKHLLSYLSKKLGVSIQNNRISGKHSTEVLSILLIKYIQRYVLCANCRLPELVNKTCNVCGHGY